jgi:hypothetical protein
MKGYEIGIRINPKHDGLTIDDKLLGAQRRRSRDNGRPRKMAAGA